MTYAVSAALQVAVYQRLLADAALAQSVGSNIYDALPAGALPDTYVLIGPEKVRDASDQTGRGAEHDFTVAVVSGASGFAGAKVAAAAICDALLGSALALTRGHVVGISFHRAEAARVGTGQDRRITLIFRARVGDA
jgi:hypothetical protein